MGPTDPGHWLSTSSPNASTALVRFEQFQLAGAKGTEVHANCNLSQALRRQALNNFHLLIHIRFNFCL
ncbi:MAG: hypothetical protein DHS20C11_10400 [Lysobacteraceae bacterium]|nr:MAG: hypothetical protein DHS20C11_10400 [Xanthomonadaceae bacterium]